nr:hypothetical protein Iba_chr09eCG14000 [Ipomoea batatas]
MHRWYRCPEPLLPSTTVVVSRGVHASVDVLIATQATRTMEALLQACGGAYANLTQLMEVDANKSKVAIIFAASGGGAYANPTHGSGCEQIQGGDNLRRLLLVQYIL